MIGSGLPSRVALAARARARAVARPGSMSRAGFDEVGWWASRHGRQRTQGASVPLKVGLGHGASFVDTRDQTPQFRAVLPLEDLQRPRLLQMFGRHLRHRRRVTLLLVCASGEGADSLCGQLGGRGRSMKRQHPLFVLWRWAKPLFSDRELGLASTFLAAAVVLALVGLGFFINYTIETRSALIRKF